MECIYHILFIARPGLWVHPIIQHMIKWYHAPLRRMPGRDVMIHARELSAKNNSFGRKGVSKWQREQTLELYMNFFFNNPKILHTERPNVSWAHCKVCIQWAWDALKKCSNSRASWHQLALMCTKDLHKYSCWVCIPTSKYMLTGDPQLILFLNEWCLGKALKHK